MATGDAKPMRLGLPVATLRAMVTQAEAAGQERLYLTVPTGLLQEAVVEAAAGRDVEAMGHSGGGGGIGQDELALELELDDESFDVVGAYRSW
jgi:hypothetical protein